MSQLLPDGILDTSFGDDGVAVTWLDVAVRHVATGPINGEIVEFGSKLSETGDFAVVRCLNDGTLDTGFGSSGGN